MKNGIVWKVIGWIISIFLLFMALVFLFDGSVRGFFAGLLFLIGAIVVNPICIFLIEKYTGFSLKKWLAGVVAGVAFFAGVVAAPHTETVQEPEKAIVEEVVEEGPSEEELAKAEEEEQKKIEAEKKAEEEKKKEAEEKKKKEEEEKKAKEAEEAEKKEVEESKKVEEKQTKEVESETTKKAEEEAVATVEESTPVETPAPVAEVEPAQTTESPTNDNTPKETATTGGGNGGDNFGEATQSGYYIIVNAKNGKIHNSTCHNLPKEYNQIIYGTLDEAKAAGYSDLCGNCMK